MRAYFLLILSIKALPYLNFQFLEKLYRLFVIISIEILVLLKFFVFFDLAFLLHYSLVFQFDNIVNPEKRIQL